MMTKEEMKKRGLIFIEDMSVEEHEKFEAERREKAKKLENWMIPVEGYAIDGLERFSAMEETDDIAKRKSYNEQELSK